jgi:SAM-dependent methyltransferase
MSALTPLNPALDAYERLADHYDLFTAGYQYRRWVTVLDRLATDHGMRGRRALDLACGTGRALQPLLDLGYEVVGCDLSPSMVAVARERHPDVSLAVADLRALPELGRFDLVLCLDDVFNYLLDERELRAAFRSVRTVLASGGLMVFDVNTSLTYETAFSRDRVVSDDSRVLAWRGHGLHESTQVARATVEIFVAEPGSGLWSKEQSEHVQRHWEEAALATAAEAEGLFIVDCLGQRTGAVLEPELDPARHGKAVYVVRTSDDSALRPRRERRFR